MKRVAIIGGGISGISAFRFLEADHEVTLFEKNSNLGGLIQCEWVNNSLFHKVGGHVFNTKVEKVADWFWSHFDKENEFIKAKRNAKILFNGSEIGYPIENHLFQLPHEMIEKVISDFVSIQNSNVSDYSNFKDFLEGNFGKTLYELYFGPYNQKIWNTDLSEVPLEWLEGKLPMPDYKDMIFRNIIREEEKGMVHASFFYPVKNGSQFIIDRLSEGINKVLNYQVRKVHSENDKYIINDDQEFDSVVYCGDVRVLGQILEVENKSVIQSLQEAISLKSNGTSNYFCESDPTDTSWLYLPDDALKAHRIIYTGNFSTENNNTESGRITCVVEFSGIMDEEEMRSQLTELPGNLKPLKPNFEPNSYVIQNHGSRELIRNIKDQLDPKGFHLLGRFAEWEYFNMDKCIESAMNLRDKWFN